MVAHAFDDCNRAGVAHCKPLARDSRKIALSGCRAIQHGVADYDVFMRGQSGILGRLDADASAAQPLAHIVVAFAVQFEGHAMRQKGAETLAGSAGEFNGDGVGRQTGMAVAFRDLM